MYVFQSLTTRQTNSGAHRQKSRSSLSAKPHDYFDRTFVYNFLTHSHLVMIYDYDSIHMYKPLTI